MPASIVRRASEVLRHLEEANRRDGLAPEKQLATLDAPAGMQLSFFQLDDPLLAQVRDAIAGLDINRLTPMDALNKLNDIQQMITGK